MKLRKDGRTSVTPAELVEKMGSDSITQILMDDDGVPDPDKFVKSYRDAVMVNREKNNLEHLKKENIAEFIKISKKIKGTKKGDKDDINR